MVADRTDDKLQPQDEKVRYCSVVYVVFCRYCDISCCVFVCYVFHFPCYVMCVCPIRIINNFCHGPLPGHESQLGHVRKFTVSALGGGLCQVVQFPPSLTTD